MKIYFHGATVDVTRSAYHVVTKHASVLVDCGMFQGGRQEAAKNRRHTKLEGGKIAEVEKPKKLAPVVDLMAALKQSLAEMEGKKKPAATASREPAAAGKRSRGRG